MGLFTFSEAAKNAKLLRDFQLIPKLLLTLRDTSLSQPTIAAISNVLSLLLQGFPKSCDLLRYAAWMTLPMGSCNWTAGSFSLYQCQQVTRVHSSVIHSTVTLQKL